MPKGRTTYAQVQSDGSVVFDFPGHVSAQGLDLVAGATNSPPNDRKIIWHQVNFQGALVADIFAYSNNDTVNASGESILELDVISPNQSHGSNLLVRSNNNPSVLGGTGECLTRVDAIADVNVATILDGLNRSTFTRSLNGGYRDDFSLLGQTVMTALAGPTGAGGFSYTFNLPFSFPNTIKGAWLDAINPQNANIQYRVYPNGTNNSVLGWFYNGTGANQNLSANLYLAGN